MQTFCGQTVTVIDTDALQCGHVSDVGVLALGRGCGQLVFISLGCCGNVTEAGILALVRMCGKLQSIDLFGCNKVTDGGLSALGRGLCR